MSRVIILFLNRHTDKMNQFVFNQKVYSLQRFVKFLSLSILRIYNYLKYIEIKKYFNLFQCVSTY
jgi:hypothetical protein